MIDHLTRLARLVYAVRTGQTVTSGPFVDDSRRRVTTTQEWFYIGMCRVSRSDALLHRTRVQMGSNDSTAGDTTQVTDWSPQDVMKTSAEWNADELDALPALPAPGTDAAVDAIMALADGDWHQFAGRTARVVEDASDEACPWTIEDKNHYEGSPLKPLYDGFSDLVFWRRTAL